jgi:hypothetical protein
LISLVAIPLRGSKPDLSQKTSAERDFEPTLKVVLTHVRFAPAKPTSSD